MVTQLVHICTNLYALLQKKQLSAAERSADSERAGGTGARTYCIDIAVLVYLRANVLPLLRSPRTIPGAAVTDGSLAEELLQQRRHARALFFTNTTQHTLGFPFPHHAGVM